MINDVVLTGRLTREPTCNWTRTTEKFVANLSIAIDGRGENAPAIFVNATAWEKQAEFAQKFLHKGDMIALTGRLANCVRVVGKPDLSELMNLNLIEVVATHLEFGETKAARDARMKVAGAAAGVDEMEVDDGETPF